MFTQSEIEQFRSEGWVAKEEFWSEREVAAMRAELDRLKAVGLLRNVATAGDGETPSTDKVNLQLCPMFPHSDFFRAMPFADKAIEAVRALIGDPVLLHLDQVFLKPGLQGMGTNWHQDNAYFEIEDPLLARRCGRQCMTPQSPMAPSTSSPAATASPTSTAATPIAIITSAAIRRRTRRSPLSCRPAASLSSLTAWRTARLGNTTEKERAGVALHFINGAMDATAKSGFPLGKRPYLSGDEASGGLKEHGAVVAGTWEKEVAAVLGD